jgi:hypothetical protein
VVSSSWAASTDDSGAVLYDAGGFFTPFTSRRGFAVMSGAVMGDVVIGSDCTMARPGGGSSSLVAYDIAGNASEPAEIGTSYSCTEPADAGRVAVRTAERRLARCSGSASQWVFS